MTPSPTSPAGRAARRLGGGARREAARPPRAPRRACARRPPSRTEARRPRTGGLRSRSPSSHLLRRRWLALKPGSRVAGCASMGPLTERMRDSGTCGARATSRRRSAISSPPLWEYFQQNSSTCSWSLAAETPWQVPASLALRFDMQWCTAGRLASESPSEAEGRATASQPPARAEDCAGCPSHLTWWRRLTWAAQKAS